MESLLTCSATQIAKKIKSGEITSLQAVEAHIDRIRKINPVINAMVKDRFDLARTEAEAADQALKEKGAGDLPPFHGVPCTIKECFALAGMPNASGLIARKDVIAEQSATAVERVLNAGAIPMGVTNTSELCMWMETNNRLYGRTNNPYDAKHIVGGSSGGEGATIGGGGSPFGIGSDVGGSIRMPAFFNGVFGHKPTGGTIPNTGQYPTAEGVALRYLTTGPLTRRAEDLYPLLQLLAGPDGKDDGVLEWEIKDPAGVDLSGLKVINVESNGKTFVTEELIRSQRKAADHFKKMGADVQSISIPGLEKSMDIWSIMLLEAGGPSFAEMLGVGTAAGAFKELGSWITRRTPHTLPAILLALVEKAPALSKKYMQKTMDAGRDLRERLVEAIGDDGIMLYPSYARVAPRHYAPLFRPFEYVYTAILNVMELPVTQVPMGLNENGLPLGIQVAAVHGNDHLTIAAAMELEKAFGGWTFPK